MQRKIKNSLPERFHTKYASNIEKFMNDVSQHYNETIIAFNHQRFSIQKNENAEEALEIERFKFKHSGRTNHHNKFLRNRRILKENLFIPYPFIRFILHSSYQRFPLVLNDYSAYKKSKSEICIWLTLYEFESAAQRDLERNAIFLREEWYPRIVQVLLKHYRKRLFPPHTWQKMFNCAKGLINRQINELKLNTFKHIFDILRARTKMPPIKFQAICSNGSIQLHPNFKEILLTFQRIFKNIAAVATRFPSLEPLIDRTTYVTTENYLKIELGDITFNQLLEQLETELHTAYNPILNYIESLEDEFYDLYSEETRNNLNEILNEPRLIDDYFEQIAAFGVYVERIQKTIRNQVFDNAIIDQSKALIGLRTIAQDYINEITQKIIDEHKKNCQRICNWFENVQKRAVEAPKSTETLLENGEFMLQMKNKKISDIRDHIQTSLKVKKHFQFDIHIIRINLFFICVDKQSFD